MMRKLVLVAVVAVCAAAPHAQTGPVQAIGTSCEAGCLTPSRTQPMLIRMPWSVGPRPSGPAAGHCDLTAARGQGRQWAERRERRCPDRRPRCGPHPGLDRMPRALYIDRIINSDETIN